MGLWVMSSCFKAFPAAPQHAARARKFKDDVGRPADACSEGEERQFPALRDQSVAKDGFPDSRNPKPKTLNANIVGSTRESP